VNLKGRMRSPDGFIVDDYQQQPIQQRMWKCEGLFAESKQYHCLARAKYRGRSKVQIQAYLCAIVQNLKRLLFPLNYWLLAHRWSYSTNTALALPSNQSRPQSTAKLKIHSHFFKRPGSFWARLSQRLGHRKIDQFGGVGVQVALEPLKKVRRSAAGATLGEVVH
jgi:hypothetical protein